MPKQRLQIGSVQVMVDLDQYVDLSIPVGPEGVTAWGRERAGIAPYQSGDFTGSIREGASVNFNDIAFNPHAHGTHTESVGHILEDVRHLLLSPPPPWILAELISVRPEATPWGQVILPSHIPSGYNEKGVSALILRTLPNPESKRQRNWSGSHPPFLHEDTVAGLAADGIEHLLVDMPSVDPEEDGGALAAHRAFWGLPDAPRHSATITELIYVPEEVDDGTYVLNLQIGGFANDACPSRPLIFEVEFA